MVESDLESNSVKKKITEKLRERTIKSFMDILVLAELKKGKSMSGYDVISFIHEKFGMLVSSGTIYSLLYSLERDGLIKGTWNNRKRVYELTEEGEQDIKIITNANGEIQNLLRKMISFSQS